jgi:hypothetical protein
MVIGKSEGLDGVVGSEHHLGLLGNESDVSTVVEFVPGDHMGVVRPQFLRGRT